MKVYKAHGKLAVTAYRVPRCADCGQRLAYEQRTFRLPVTSGEIGPVEIGFLMDRVETWRVTPVPCGGCPEQAVSAP